MLALAVLPAAALAADITRNPTIAGTLQSGQRLTASAAWTPQNSPPTWAWLRCTSPSDWWSCDVAQNGSNSAYVLTPTDAGKFMRVWLSVGSGRDRDDAVSNATAAVAAVPTPTPTPAATPEPTPVPTPEPPPPVFEAAPAPVQTQAPILHTQGDNLRTLRPAPKVRMRGTLSPRGANVTLLSVRAPKRASITVTCKGSGCPRKRYTTKQAKVRVRVFERDLPAKTRLEVRVRRAGYYGKSTVFIIRRGKAPHRLDRCLSARGRYTACPK
ncbi:hypothetical protein OJ997_20805 [Solirubrobacter phytolaccae]|uniref:Uncharacterized protein n=1 Tax=Solirubrobacter phytolaccae TaxID=1404360 RepID=A0A9X3SCP5_9ACTN|nr:hypothetical protein [Solirubrobacter phytolaccae]MDA0182765.1 hypothetical protein [Solirubrobacter phytolaccae]